MPTEDRLDLMTREFAGEVMQTAWTLEDAMASILEQLPPGSFPGESNIAGLLKEAIDTMKPVTFAAGEESCRIAIALIGAARDRMRAELPAAADRHRGRG
jgi:hypothetical protein